MWSMMKYMIKGLEDLAEHSIWKTINISHYEVHPKGGIYHIMLKLWHSTLSFIIYILHTDYDCYFLHIKVQKWNNDFSHAVIPVNLRLYYMLAIKNKITERTTEIKN